MLRHDTHPVPATIESLHSGIGERRRRFMRTARKFSNRIAQDLYCGIEMLAIFLAGLLVAEIHVGRVLDDTDYLGSYIWPLVLAPIATGVLGYRNHLYDMAKLTRFITGSPRAIAALTSAFIAIALLGVAFDVTSEFSRGWYGGWFILAAVAIWVLRALAARIFRHWTRTGVLQYRIAIFGHGPPLQKLVSDFRNTHDAFVLTGVYGPEGHDKAPTLRSLDGDLDALIAFGQAQPLDCVIIALPPNNDGQLRQAYDKLAMLPSEIKLLPALGSHDLPFCGVSAFNRAQFIDVERKSISDWGRIVKLVEDYLVACSAMVLLSPLFLLVAIAIKLDSPGPVFFSQKRHGLGNREFDIYKFRTMYVTEEDGAFHQTIRRDARVTRIGRLLRRTSIDELPQLFNVLRGEMSIVGPRPHPLSLNRKYCERLPMYNKRHRLKPGITGWAQVNDHRGPTIEDEDMRERLKHDVYYIDNWSLWLDLSIIAATPLVGIFHKNAV